MDKINPFSNHEEPNFIEIVTVHPCARTDLKTVAFVDIRDGHFRIKGLCVVLGINGPFATLPKRKSGAKWYEIVEVDEPRCSQIFKAVLADQRVRELIEAKR